MSQSSEFPTPFQPPVMGAPAVDPNAQAAAYYDAQQRYSAEAALQNPGTPKEGLEAIVTAYPDLLPYAALHPAFRVRNSRNLFTASVSTIGFAIVLSTIAQASGTQSATLVTLSGLGILIGIAMLIVAFVRMANLADQAASDIIRMDFANRMQAQLSLTPHTPAIPNQP